MDPLDDLRAAPPEHPAVTEAMDVVRRSLRRMADAETRPMLEEPGLDHRVRAVGPVRLFPVILRLSGFDDRTAATVLKTFAAAGGTAVDVEDTAGEEQLGRLSPRRGPRAVLSVTAGREPGGLSAAALARRIDQARRSLRAECLDLLTLAPGDRSTPLEETLTALRGHLTAGAIRAVVAGAGFTVERLIAIRVVAGQLGLPLLDGLRAPYSLLERDHESTLSPIAVGQRLAVLPTAALAGGALAPSLTHPRGAAGRRAARIREVAARIALERSVPAAAVPLAWLLTRPAVVAPIVTVTRLEQVAAVVAAPRLHLTRGEAAALERAGAR